MDSRFRGNDDVNDVPEPILRIWHYVMPFRLFCLDGRARVQRTFLTCPFKVFDAAVSQIARTKAAE
jgi:hypothetical protein